MNKMTKRLKCLNSALSWELAFVNAEYNLIKCDIPVLQVVTIASRVRNEFCIPVNDIEFDQRQALVELLMEYFPIMFLTKNEYSVLVDVNELLLEKNAFMLLLSDTTTNESEDKNKDKGNGPQEEEEEIAPFIGPKMRKGRKTLHERFPSIIDEATNFIKEHSFSAHVRRRETTATGRGITLNDIRKHLLDNVPGLAEDGGISTDTVHHLTYPPRKNSIRAHGFKKLIAACVSGKRNQYREGNKNQHFMFARVAYREEFVFKFKHEAVFFSSDDMNKLRMGPSTAVSRYHQISRFFMANDSPNTGDHDFPNPGYLLIPSGYVFVTF